MKRVHVLWRERRQLGPIRSFDVLTARALEQDATQHRPADLQELAVRDEMYGIDVALVAGRKKAT
eukprot:CAMPEP_0183719470 /NCGR_PEP_ID=MMETSP0737-20130205/12396_1 /TAXON_ID=385413 /ORGANISM="Thalassiosira miniscula, Strain CCMP1093" /LENGTH=64 /DNA_ID=CAMNT_0025949189 /DNA_START=352 /DNA_END=546 /DNA_ORIENTATION=-